MDVEKQPVNQASTDDTEDVPKLTFIHEKLLQEQANDPEIRSFTTMHLLSTK